MSTFNVRARHIRAIEPHENADRLEMAVIDDYRAVVGKGSHKPGDLVIYIPEAAVCPEFVLRTSKLWDEALGKGKCGGEAGNRIIALKLRGKLSQGLVYPLSHICDHPTGPGWYLQDCDATLWRMEEGDDAAGLLNIHKHKPVIPAELDGLVLDGGIDVMPKFDIEDIRAHPGVIADGEDVVMTEKLHGTFCGFVRLPRAHAVPVNGRYLSFSKGLTEQGLAFQHVPENSENPYVKAFTSLGIAERLEALACFLANRGLNVEETPLFLFGEVIGSASRQDLKYGAQHGFRAFAAGHGFRTALTYLDYDDLVLATNHIGIERVPLVWRGPFSAQALAAATTGRENISGKQLHIREGVVVQPALERRHDAIGRVALKSVSADYLVRGGSATEFQ